MRPGIVPSLDRFLRRPRSFGHEASARTPAIPSAASYGPARIPGQAAFRPTRNPRPRRTPGANGRRGRRRREGDRLPLRHQGPGEDRRPRQGRRHQDRQRRGRGARSTPTPSSAWTSRASRSTRCGSRGASQIETEYYASIVFDRGAKAPLIMLSTQGGMDIEQVAESNPSAIATLHVDPLLGFQDFHGRRLAFEAGVDADLVRPVGAFLHKLYGTFVAEEATARRGQPADRHARAQGRRAGRQGHAGRQRAVPPPGQRRPARPVRRGPAGADGQGARADLRQARRRHRHPRQRRRAGHVDAGRRRPVRRRAGQLPGRRRRIQGRGDHQRGRGDPVRRQGQGRVVQHLRRHHALRRGRQRPHRGVQDAEPERPVRRPPGRHQRRGGPRRSSPRRALPNVHTAATMDEAAEKVVALAKGEAA